MSRYFISKGGKQMGPWSQAEVRELLRRKTIKMDDYIFDSTTQHWCVVASHKDFSPAPTQQEVLLQEAVESFDFARSQDWYIQRRCKPASEDTDMVALTMRNDEVAVMYHKEQGPYTYFDLIKLIQLGQLGFEDRVFHPMEKQWRIINECIEFRPDSVRSVLNASDDDLNKVFFQRSFMRIPYSSPMFVHNNKNVLMATGHEVSPQGLGFKIEEERFDVGDSVFLHMKHAGQLPPFNAIGMVMNRRFLGSNQILYGVKFTNLSQPTQVELNKFYEEYKTQTLGPRRAA